MFVKLYNIDRKFLKILYLTVLPHIGETISCPINEKEESCKVHDVIYRPVNYNETEIDIILETNIQRCGIN